MHRVRDPPHPERGGAPARRRARSREVRHPRPLPQRAAQQHGDHGSRRRARRVPRGAVGDHRLRLASDRRRGEPARLLRHAARHRPGRSVVPDDGELPLRRPRPSAVDGLRSSAVHGFRRNGDPAPDVHLVRSHAAGAGSRRSLSARAARLHPERAAARRGVRRPRATPAVRPALRHVAAPLGVSRPDEGRMRSDASAIERPVVRARRRGDLRADPLGGAQDRPLRGAPRLHPAPQADDRLALYGRGPEERAVYRVRTVRRRARPLRGRARARRPGTLGGAGAHRSARLEDRRAERRDDERAGYAGLPPHRRAERDGRRRSPPTRRTGATRRSTRRGGTRDPSSSIPSSR